MIVYQSTFLRGALYVCVAQLDRASDYGSEGRVFESCRTHFFNRIERYGYSFLYTFFAEVAELADALDSGSSESNFMWVQVPSPAYKNRTVFYSSVFVLSANLYIIGSLPCAVSALPQCLWLSPPE